jgi:formiminotetrahydrofolate cyclodeaminase
VEDWRSATSDLVTVSAERSLQLLLADLSARSPAPGGGAASAWAGALAAALTEMSASFADAGESAARAAELRAQLLAAGERELQSYLPVLEAQRLPSDHPSRRERIEAALTEASQAPLAIARASAEVSELAAALSRAGKPSLAGDAIAGAVLGEAATRAAARLVEINLGDRRPHELPELIARAAAARELALRTD